MYPTPEAAKTMIPLYGISCRFNVRKGDGDAYNANVAIKACVLTAEAMLINVECELWERRKLR